MTFLRNFVIGAYVFNGAYAFKEEVKDENGILRQVEMDVAWLRPGVITDHNRPICLKGSVNTKSANQYIIMIRENWFGTSESVQYIFCCLSWDKNDMDSYCIPR